MVALEEGALVRPARLRGGGVRLIEQLRDRADGGMTADEVLRLTRSEQD